MQLIAGYILDSVKTILKDLDQKKVNGLLKYLSHFELEIDNSIETKNEIDPFVAVINNIISRGIPTKPSVFIEEEINNAFNKAEQEHPIKLGSINFIPKYTEDEKQEIFEAFHIIEPRLKLNQENYQIQNLDSNFEKDFLFEYLNGKNANYLIQILETQREIDSIISPNKAKNFNRQRVDFSIEFPYQLTEKYIKYGEERTKQYYYGLVIEIDGKHHTKIEQQILDDFRNNAINEVKWKIFRINNLNRTNFNEWISKSSYYKILRKNYYKQISGNWKEILQITLSPFAIARIQKTIIELINSGKLSIDDKEWNILVYERDIPGAKLAFQDLKQMFNNLYRLADVNKTFPKINLDIISTPEFIYSPLHKGANVYTIKTFNQNKDYDLFLDISTLTRANILKDENTFSAKTQVKIRSSHSIKTKRKIITTDLIKFRKITIKDENENYIPIDEAEKPLTYFLQNIFRKEKFREGQLPILNRALQQKSVIGLLPTGGGKSLTYQLASLLQPGVTIVIDPIKSLMQDQYDNLIKNGIDFCNFINSKLDTTERRVETNKLVEGEVMFSFVSPERLQIKEFRDNLNEMPNKDVYFSYCVIDEVHCVSEWGHDFRTSYLSLGKNAIEHCKVKNLKHIPIFGLTATASFDVLSDVERELSGNGKTDLDAEAIIRFENSNRDELQYQILNVDAEFETNDKFYIKNPNGQIINGIPKPIDEDVKIKIATTKQTRLNELLEEIPFMLDKLNNKAVKLVESSKKREIENRNKEKYCIKIEDFDPKNFYNDNNTNAGIIFCPHRSWYQGVTDRFKFDKYDEDIYDEEGYLIHKKGEFVLDKNGNKVKLPPAKRKGIADNIEKHFPNLKVGFFMGTSDDEEKIGKEIEKASFENQKKFINNELNIMVATKAFGMGIDKPNIRFTVHFNIPNSIESFVQEAGRAGRDRKIALSSILFNQQTIYIFNDKFYKKIANEVDNNTYSKLRRLKGLKFLKKDIQSLFNKLEIPEIKNFEEHIGKIQLDRDNLLFFHNNSFKGPEKEKWIIYELLSEITYPNKNNKFHLEEKIKEKFDIKTIKLNYVKSDEILWVNGDFKKNYGRIDIKTWDYFFFKHHPIKLSKEIFDFIKETISKGCDITNVDEVSNWLQINQQVFPEKGIEERLKEVEIGEEIKPEIVLQFSNKTANQEHYIKLLKNELNKWFPNNNLTDEIIKKSISRDFNVFVEKLQKNCPSIPILNNIDQLIILKKIFYSPRKKEDTDKAIFRLMSIGVIDDYTVDYNKKTYTLKIIKKKPEEYKVNLENYIRRYYSDIKAKNEIEKVDTYKGKSEIQKCLGYLTDFVYSEIEKKRLRSIDDMIFACEVGLEENTDANEELKDFIFLYFNSKYARQNYEINGIPYSLLVDTNEGKDFSFDIIWKYIKAVNDDTSGAQKDNVKHLRGACLRLLRSNPENPSLLLLKSFSLFVLGYGNNKTLEEETKRSFIEGFKLMKGHLPELSFDELISNIQKFRNLVLENANNEKEVSSIIDKYINELYFKLHSEWLNNFTNKYLKGYDR